MTGDRAGDLEGDFERLLFGWDDEGPPAEPPAGGEGPGPRERRGLRLAGAAIVLVALIGVALVGGGLWWAGGPPDPRPTPEAAAAEDADRPLAAEPGSDGDADARAGGGAQEPSSGAAREPAGSPAADPAWLARVSGASGVPERALAAYAAAALTVGRERPWCGIGWNTLAAIGHVESAHGSIGGSALDPSGTVLPRVIGVRLDGTRFDAVPDTDGGRLDGDAQWDRAVGPMQFLPQTWADYGRDGNGDGLAQVDQIDDAALSAATMLCDVGGDLRIAQNWIVAVHAYNPSVAYNNAVAEAADYYAGFA